MAYININNPVYISYAWGEDLELNVNRLCELMEKNDIYFKRDKAKGANSLCPYRYNIIDAEEEIGLGKTIIVVISDKYIKSLNCMYEWHCICKTGDIQKRVFPIVLPNTNLKKDYRYNSFVSCFIDRLQEISDRDVKSSVSKIEKKLLENDGYLSDLEKLRKYLQENNVLDLESLQENDYAEIINQLKQHVASVEYPTPQEIQQPLVATAPSFRFDIIDNLVARNEVVEKLHDLVSQNRVTNLYGFGGSGKTSLVNLFAQQYASEFSQMAYVVVNNSIKDDFVSQINETIKIFKPEENVGKDFRKIKNLDAIVELSKGKEDRYQSVISYLETNYKSDTPNLLIIDINNAPDGEAAKFGEDLATKTLTYNKIYPKGWKYLIVSRENIYAGVAKLNLNEKETENSDFLKSLFLKSAGEEKYKDFGDEEYAELFKKMHYSPLLAEQLGIYLQNDDNKYSLSEIFALLDNKNFKNQKRYGITSQNRNSAEENTIIGFLRNLVVFDRMNKEEQILLKHFVLWPTDYIPQDVIQKLLSTSFHSETNRWTKLWSIIKHYFDFSSWGTNRIGVFYNKTGRYKVTKIWFYLSLILWVLLFCLGAKEIPISHLVKTVLLGMSGAVLYFCFEIVFHQCTFRPAFNNVLRVIIGGVGGLCLGYLLPTSIMTGFVILIFSPFIFSFPLFVKKIINCIFSTSYLQNVNPSVIEDVLLKFTQKRFVSQNVINNQKCYKLHGLIAESIKQQIDIQHIDYSDYLGTVRKIANNDYKDFVPFAQYIGNSLRELNVGISFYQLLTIAFKLCNNTLYANITAALYNKVINWLKDGFIDYFAKRILALAYSSLGSLQREQLHDYGSALTNYNKVIVICEKLPKYNSKYHQYVLARTYYGRAYCYDAFNNYDDAIKSVTTAIGIATILKEKDSKYLIDWLAFRHSWAEIKFNNGKDLEDVKNTLLEIKPLVQQCLNNNPYKNWTKKLNDEIDELLSKLEEQNQ